MQKSRVWLLRNEQSRNTEHILEDVIMGWAWGEAAAFKDCALQFAPRVYQYVTFLALTALKFAFKNLCWSEMFPWSVNWYKYFGRQFGNIIF